jgi:prepilin-type N-terminal cleavage/methylation domain-containing protein
MLRNRKGVTLFEIMTVMTLAAILMAITFPHMKDTRRAASMQSARTQVESFLSIARSIAVRNGGKTRLVRTGGKLEIEADTGTGWVTVVRPVHFGEVSNVKLESTVSTIEYDSRGLATGLAASGEKFYITAASGYGAGTKDSICITRLGALLNRTCGLAVTPPEKEIDPDIIILDEEPIISTEPIVVGPITIGPIVVK